MYTPLSALYRAKQLGIDIEYLDNKKIRINWDKLTKSLEEKNAVKTKIAIL